jgi:hypothetical protein
MLSDGTIAQYWFRTMMQPATLNSTGDSANVLQVCYTTDTVWIRSAGLAEVMGLYNTPQVPLDQNHVIKFSRNPQQELGLNQPVPTVGGSGILINGVEFHGLGDDNSYDGVSTNAPATAGGKEIWNREVIYAEGSSLDTILNSHAGFGGNYHCHGFPKSLLPLNPNSHSPIIGYAYDGFPVYGPFGYSAPLDSLSSIARMETGYALRTSMTTRDSLPEANGTLSNPADWGPTVSASFPLGMYLEDYAYAGIGTLDEHNGRFCYTPEYPNGIYAYFSTIDATLTTAEYPYFLGRTYFGEVVIENIRPQLSVTFSYGNDCASISNNALPIELRSFTADRINTNQVQLNWATETELNNEAFDIERILHGETEWTLVGSVYGAGNSTALLNYEHLDDNSFTGVTYYRLHQRDFDGTENFSKVRAIEGLPTQDNFTLYPTPTQGIINVRFVNSEAKSATIRVYFPDGKLAFEQQHFLENEQIFQLTKTATLPTGTYFMQVIMDNGDIISRKFIKLGA